MEIYRDSTTSKVMLPAPLEVDPIGDTIDIKAVNADGTVLHVFDEVYRVPAGFAVNLPWSLVREDKEFFVDWAFTYEEGESVKALQHRSHVEVVTPIVPLSEVAEISGFDDYTDVMDLERQVRYAVQKYCGQNFGRFRATIRLRGRGDYSMPLPYPLLEIGRVRGSATGFIPGSGLYVSEGGWAINLHHDPYYGIKAAPPEEALDFYVSTGVLRAPGLSRPYFHERAEYFVSGLWGFYDVPSDVQQAAKMLIADYSCDESLWRDRYLDSVRAADWRFEFNAQAFSGTGNVQADHILDSYRRMSMAVV